MYHAAMNVLSNKKLFLLDMDGTIYLDEILFPAVPEFLTFIREKGGRALYLTNNSSRGIEAYLEKMTRLGLPARPEDFVTSLDATVALLRHEYRPRLIYAVATASMKGQLRAAGFTLASRVEEKPDLLLIGFDRELTYQKLEDACRLLQEDIPYLATNPDWVCPTSFGFEPDCGSICEMLWRATGKRPRFVGKPEAAMVELALEKTGCAKEECLLIGDRLYTDIACGINAGVDTVFVLSGEGKREDIEEMQIRPRFVYQDIGALLKDMKGEIV